MAVAFGLSLFGASAWAQSWPASDPAALFVPNQQGVALSEFVAAPANSATQLSVRPQILDWLQLQGATIQVAMRTGAGISEVLPDAVDVVSGLVTYTPSQAADLVVVSPALRGVDAIATHWNASLNWSALLNAFRGGQQVGATDGIVSLTLNAAQMGLAKTGSILNPDPTFADAGGHQYYWDTQNYALFSDGTEQPAAGGTTVADMLVPSYEHYVAENWTVLAPSAGAAVWLSDQTRQATGLPIRHLNGHEAFESGTPAQRQITEDLPIMQVVHAFITDSGGSAIEGSENSLATFLVPPGWSATPITPYTVLMNSFYGLHDNVFGTHGPSHLALIGSMATDPAEPQSVVGVFMNGGGGSTSCLTQQHSIYANTSQLFAAASTLLGVDKHKVVIVGGSRGGTSALGMGSHPDAGFTAQYIVAGAPVVYPGENIDLYSNPTHLLAHGAIQATSGYVDAYKNDFVATSSGLKGEVLSLQALYGALDFSKPNSATVASLPTDVFSPGNGSEAMLNSLVAKGSRLIMRNGTHDTSLPFSHTLRYYAAALGANVPVRLEISYRMGHGAALNTQPDLATLLKRTISGDHSAFAAEQGMRHYHPITAADEATLQGTQFCPDEVPMIVEMPAFAGATQEHTYTVAGPPGTLYALFLELNWKSDWLTFNMWPPAVGPWLALGPLYLPPDSVPAIGYSYVNFTAPGGFNTGAVSRVRLFYRDSTGSTFQAPDTGTAPPGAVAGTPDLWDQAAATVWNDDPVEGTFLLDLMKNRGQGLSSDVWGWYVPCSSN